MNKHGWLGDILLNVFLILFLIFILSFILSYSKETEILDKEYNECIMKSNDKCDILHCDSERAISYNKANNLLLQEQICILNKLEGL